jgi:hypothetical protein
MWPKPGRIFNYNIWCFAAMNSVEPPLLGLLVLDWTADGSCGKHTDTQPPHLQLSTMLHLVAAPRPGPAALMQML